MVAVLRILPGDVDLWSSETLNIVGPIGTIIALITFLYWALAKEKLVTGAAHRRELDRLEVTQRRELGARDDSIKAERLEHATEVLGLRTDHAATLTRREAELQGVIEGLRLDVSRMFAAWQITDDARERVTNSRLDANSATMTTMLEALRHSPIRDRVAPAELPPGHEGPDGTDG